jgi:hypothetical protein
VLYHLTTPEDGQPLWSVDDLNREMERRDVIDYLNGLHRAGLIYRTRDGFVFATRAAVRMVGLVIRSGRERHVAGRGACSKMLQDAGIRPTAW